MALLLSFLCSALPGFAQALITSLNGTGLNGPTFVAIDPNRTIGGTTATWLYVSEHGETNNTGGGRILRFNLTSGANSYTVVAPSGTADGQFTSPDGIVIDSATGDLFIADRAQNRVQRITNTGTFVSQFGVGELRGPTGMVRDGAGNFYLTEHGDTTPPEAQGTGGGFISKYNAAGVQQWRVGGQGGGDGQFAVTGPYGIALAGSSVLVSDSFSQRIQSFSTATGAYESQFSTGGGSLPLGLSIDSTGALWIAMSSGGGSGAVQQVEKRTIAGASSGVVLTSSSPALSLPFHAVVDVAANRAYVADYGNDRVAVFDLTSGPSGSPPTINSGASASGTVGAAFSYQITATNSPTAYAVASGTLPAGLTLNTSSGLISGTPTVAGNATVGLTATNGSGTSATFNLDLTIAAAPAPSTPIGPTITSFELVSGTFTNGTMRVVFDTAVTGVDAADFTINAQGTASGTVTSVSGSGTTYDVNFDYVDNDGSIQMAILTTGAGIAAGTDAFRGNGLTATPIYDTGSVSPADILRPVVDSFTAGTPSGSTVAFTLTFNEAVTGVDASDFIVVTGGSAGGTVASVAGSGTSYTVNVDFTGTGTIQLTVVGGASANIRDAATNWFGGNGAAQSAVATVTTGGGGDTTAPTVSSFAVGTNAGTTVNFALTFNEAVTGVDSADFTVGGTGAAGATIGVVSGSGTSYTIPVTYTAVSGTVNLMVSGGATANIRDAATNLFVGPSTSASYTITAGGGGDTTAPTVSSFTAGTASGSTVNFTLTFSEVVTGVDATDFTVGGSGATGATVGSISGTGATYTIPVTYVASGGTLNVTVSGGVARNIQDAASNLFVGPSTSSAYTIPAAGSPPTISNQSASGTQGAAFSYQVTASGATSFSIVGSPALPAGLSMSSSGLITGTPTASGSTTLTVRATNADGSADASMTLNITPAPTPGSGPMIFSATVAGTQGAAFSYQVVASGATSYLAATPLPAGLSLDTQTGVISGSPTDAGTTDTVIRAINADGTHDALITFNIEPSTQPVPTESPLVASATITGRVGTPIEYYVKATNPPHAFTLTGQPAGLTIDAATGLISGTPMVIGTYSATVTAQNAAGSANATLTFNILSEGSGIQTQTITLISPVSDIFVGDVVTLSGSASSGLPVTYSIVSGNGTISGNQLVMTSAGSVIVRAAQAGNSTYAPASADTTFVAVRRQQQLSTGSLGGSVTTDSAIRLTASASSGLPLTYTVVSGPARIENGSLVFTGSGEVQVRVSQAGNSMFDGAETILTFNGRAVDRLVNISSRLRVTGSDSTRAYIAGFVVTGDTPRQMLIRAVGPTLSKFSVNDGLADPQLTLFNNQGAVVAANSGWADDAQITAAGDGVGAFRLDAGSKDSAILATLAPGAYTAQVKSSNNGQVLIEVYDVSANAAVPTKQLVNISTRAYVDAGDTLTGGFVVNGSASKRVLIRAVGPTLAGFGVTGTLENPMVRVHNAQGVVIAQNNNWGTQAAPSTAAEISAAETATGAFPLLAGSADAALIVDLAPGAYTAVVSSENNASGAAMIEIYEIPNP